LTIASSVKMSSVLVMNVLSTVSRLQL